MEADDEAVAFIRYDKKFFALHINNLGTAYLVKGNSTYYTEVFKQHTSDTSQTFKLASTSSFFKGLRNLAAKPISRNKPDGEIPRMEIFLNKIKVYDGYENDGTYWNLVRPILNEIPDHLNPFQTETKRYLYN